MPFAHLLLAVALKAGLVPPPDYVGEMRFAYNAPHAIVRSHAGLTRIDAAQWKDKTASYYDAPGWPSAVTVVRDAKGEATLLWIRRKTPSSRPPDAPWTDTHQLRSLAGESCELWKDSVRGAQKCVTSDGLDLMAEPDGPRLEMTTVSRQRVAAAAVAPPLTLMDWRRWAPRRAVAAQPPRGADSDYVAVFGEGPGVQEVRRSGAWTRTNRSGGESEVVNEDIRLDVRTTAYGPELWISRMTPRAPDAPFPFKPASVKGRSTETILGETCSWQSRTWTPDASIFECRTADDALLIGGTESAYTGFALQTATRFRRGPVPLASVLPPTSAFKPETYGLGAGRAPKEPRASQREAADDRL